MTIADELLKLESLRNSGSLSDEEFEKAKSLILYGNDRVQCADCKQVFPPGQLQETKVSKTSMGYSAQGAMPVMSSEVLRLCSGCAQKRKSSEWVSVVVVLAIISVLVFVAVIVKSMRGN